MAAQGVSTFILDFQTTNFAFDSKTAIAFLTEYQRLCNNLLPNNEELFLLDPPLSSAGWSFAKLFLAGQFVEKLYELHTNEIDKSKGKKFEDKFVSWLGTKLKNNKCEAQIKIAPEMKK